MRERWYPTIFDRDNYGGWLAKGGKPLAERAAEQVANILATHKPQPLSAEVVAAIHRIVERAASSKRSMDSG
jgi:trimethylamine:corrinoid methyltransferase-like protein